MATTTATATGTVAAAHILKIIYTRNGYTHVEPIEFPQNLADVIPGQQWVSFIQRLTDIGPHATRSKPCSCCCYSCGCKVCTYIWLVFCLICVCAWLSALISALNSTEDGTLTFGYTYQVCMYSVFTLITLFGMWSCRRQVRKGMETRYQSIVSECQVLQSAVYNRIDIKSTPPGYSGSYWMTEIFININSTPLNIQQPQQYQPQQMLVQMPNGQYVQAQVIGQPQVQIQPQIQPQIQQIQQTQAPIVNAMPYNPNAMQPMDINEGGNTQNINIAPINNGEGGVTNY